MLYWLPLSRGAIPHVTQLISFTLASPLTPLTVNPQSIFHGALVQLFRKLLGRAFHRLASQRFRGRDKGEGNAEGVTAGRQMLLWGLFKCICCSLFLLCGRAKCNNDQSCCSETVLEGHVARCLHGFNELYRDSHYTSVSRNKSTDVDLLVWICAQAKGNIIKVGETCIFRLWISSSFILPSKDMQISLIEAALEISQRRQRAACVSCDGQATCPRCIPPPAEDGRMDGTRSALVSFK